MENITNILTPDQTSDRQAAIIAAGLLIDSLSASQPDVNQIKTRLYEVSKQTRDAIREIRQAEALASGVRFTAINEYLDLGI